MTATTFEVPDSKAIYSAGELAQLDLKKMPRHVAVIMDGNRRWAKQRGLPPVMGHWEGAEALTDVLKGAAELGIKTVTVYAFSTENWIRPENEIEGLMDIFELYLSRKKEHLIRDGVRLDAIGDLSRLPERVLSALSETKKATEHCDRINLVLALNYGGRNDIKRAVVKMMEDKVPPEQVTEELISKNLDTSRWGDPDLLIRTSGELRISNFLIWQISYTEIYVTDLTWPEFTAKALFDAVVTFQKRQRRLGGN
jgi:undecaprenyl diphosphate synthase